MVAHLAVMQEDPGLNLDRLELFYLKKSFNEEKSKEQEGRTTTKVIP